MFIKARGPSKSGEHNLLQGNENTGSAFRREQRDGDTFEISFINTVGPMDAFDSPLYVAVNNAVLYGMRSIILGEGESVVCKMEGNSIRVLSPRPGLPRFRPEDGRVCLQTRVRQTSSGRWATQAMLGKIPGIHSQVLPLGVSAIVTSEEKLRLKLILKYSLNCS